MTSPPLGSHEVALRTARRFAAALDRDDFSQAAALLDPEAVYLARLGALFGPNVILESYSTASAWAKANIEHVNYQSSVSACGDGSVDITFLDNLEHGGQRHTYRCVQRIRVAATGLIERIEHLELPGERQALQSYLAQVGIRQSS